MRKVNHQELKEVVIRCYETKIPLYIWGRTGIGKSETIREAAKDLAKKLNLEYYEEVNGKAEGFGLIDVRLSQFDPSDLRGLPYIESTEQKSRWAYPDWLPKIGQGILFLDELNLAPPLVQASAYQLILDRRLGSYKLPEGWIVIAAGNKLEDRARTFEMAGPLCNRFVHLELAVPTIEEWTTWATTHKVDSRIISFLNFKPSYLFRFDDKIQEKSFPTPRSWGRYCSALINSLPDSEFNQTLVASAVGEGIAVEFTAFLRLTRKIKIKDILDKPESIKEISEIDLKYALLSALAEEGKKKETFHSVIVCCKYLEPEFATLLLRFLKGSVEDFVKKIQKSPELVNIIKQYAKYLL